MLFGAYAREHEAKVADSLRAVVESHRGRLLGAANAHRVWGEKFFPVAPSRPTPEPTDRTVAEVGDSPKVLEHLSGKAVQGTVARSGEVLVLAFDETLRKIGRAEAAGW